MYDSALTRAVPERLGEGLLGLLNHPIKGILMLGGLVLVTVWLTRK